ncbi:MAG: hypothetical protein WCP30_17850 [Mycobacteriaceae bacterium]
MNATVGYAAAVLPAALVTFAGVAGLVPAVSNAAECGPGTVFDAPSNMCVVAPAPAGWDAAPPPAPPAPPLPPISICPPIPFVAVCFPVN